MEETKQDMTAWIIKALDIFKSFSNLELPLQSLPISYLILSFAISTNYYSHFICQQKTNFSYIQITAFISILLILAKLIDFVLKSISRFFVNRKQIKNKKRELSLLGKSQKHFLLKHLEQHDG